MPDNMLPDNITVTELTGKNLPDMNTIDLSDVLNEIIQSMQLFVSGTRMDDRSFRENFLRLLGNIYNYAKLNEIIVMTISQSENPDEILLLKFYNEEKYLKSITEELRTFYVDLHNDSLNEDINRDGIAQKVFSQVFNTKIGEIIDSLVTTVKLLATDDAVIIHEQDIAIESKNVMDAKPVSLQQILPENEKRHVEKVSQAIPEITELKNLLATSDKEKIFILEHMMIKAVGAFEDLQEKFLASKFSENYQSLDTAEIFSHVRQLVQGMRAGPLGANYHGLDETRRILGAYLDLVSGKYQEIINSGYGTKLFPDPPEQKSPASQPSLGETLTSTRTDHSTIASSLNSFFRNADDGSTINHADSTSTPGNTPRSSQK